MEIQGLSPKTSFLVSFSWLIARISVVIVTPFFLEYDCDNDLINFLKITFYSTIFMVGLQISYIIYKCLSKKMSSEPSKCVQIIYFCIDYIFYGIFRFVVFILGVI
jgi:hypothetical protein